MFDIEPTVEITPTTSFNIRVRDQKCIVSQDTWETAKDVLSVIGDYTNYIDVYKVDAIKLVRAACGSGLREAKLMTEAYFEPQFNNFSERGWHQYS